MVDADVEITDESDVIIPPPELRPIIETTAQYVASKGIVLEKQIAQKQRLNQKFGFLQETNPYYAFYKRQIDIFREKNPEAAAEAKKADEAAEKSAHTAQSQIQKTAQVAKQGEKAKNIADKTKNEIGEQTGLSTQKSLKSSQKKTILERVRDIINSETRPKREFVLEDKNFNFEINPPSDVLLVDIEIIKATAQFVAANGRDFLAKLSNREQKNPQFAFLKPMNASLFLYFSDLVQSYQRVLNPSKNVLNDIEEESKSEKLIYDKLIGKAEFFRREQRRQELAKKNLENEKMEMSLIDWHAFVILETIDFKDGDDQFLPPPSMSIDDINDQLAAEKRLKENIENAVMPNEEKEEENKTETKSKIDQESKSKKIERGEIEDKKTPSSIQPEPRQTPRLANSAVDQNQNKNFNPSNTKDYQKCTVCGKNIPVDQIEEHIRIELLDPKWMEQKKVAESKRRDSTLAEAAEMAKNLRNFVQVRKRPFAKPKKMEDESIIWRSGAENPSAPSAPPPKRININSAGANLNMTRIAALKANVPSLPIRNDQIGHISVDDGRNNQNNNLNSSRINATKIPQRIPQIRSQIPLQNQPQTQSRIQQQNMPQIQQQIRSKMPQQNIPQQIPPRNFQARMPFPNRFAAGIPPISSQMPLRNLSRPANATPGINMRPLNPPNPANRQNQQNAAMARNMPMQRMVSMQNSMQQAMVRNMPPPMQQRMTSMQQPLRPLPAAHEKALITQRAKFERGPLSSLQMAGMAKKTNLVPENIFLKTNPMLVKIAILVPLDGEKAQWNFNGQIIEFELRLTETIANLKSRLRERLNNMPAKKMKLKTESGIFLKDQFSLAYYNLVPGVKIIVGVKSRGGRK